MIEINVIATQLNFPEGPAFAHDGSLWAVELKGGALVRLHEGELTSYVVGGKPNGIAFDRAGKLWYCDAGRNAVCRFDPALNAIEIIATEIDGALLTEPNDLAFDRNNNLLFTCPGNSRQQPAGYVCVLQKNGQVKKIADQLFFPNGLSFTPDGKQLLIAETYQQRLWRGSWDQEECILTDNEIFAEVGGVVGPDGMAHDAVGNLYVAIFGSGEISVVNPSGEISRRIDLPGKNPSNCAFDPSAKLGLVVTETENGQLLSIQERKPAQF